MTTVRNLAELSLAVYSDPPRLGGWIPAREFGNPNSDFYAVLFENQSSNDRVLTFRGTDDLADINDDVMIFLGRSPGQLRKARNALAQSKKIIGPEKNLYLTGHSLGGGLASLLAAEQNPPLPVVTFNAPGMLRAFIHSKTETALGYVHWFRLDDKKMLHIRSTGDIVSIGAGPAIGKRRTIPMPFCHNPPPTVTERTIDVLFPPVGIARKVIRIKILHSVCMLWLTL